MAVSEGGVNAFVFVFFRCCGTCCASLQVKLLFPLIRNPKNSLCIRQNIYCFSSNVSD